MISLFIFYYSLSSDTQFLEYLDEFLVEWFVRTDSLREWNIDHFVVLDAHHDISLSLLEGLDSTNACTACKYSVTGSRATATLQVSKD